MEVFWPAKAEWFGGVVRQVNKRNDTYKIYYYSGCEKWHGDDMEARSVEETFRDMNLLLGSPTGGWSGED